jgi:hypothetical protein
MGERPRNTLTWLLAATAAVLACTPAGALAATASSDFNRLNFEAASGEANHVVLTWEGPTVRVHDTGVQLLLGCVPEGLNVVRCLAPSGDPPVGLGGCSACTALIATGDGDDSVRVVGAPVGLRMRLAGGEGDDTLSGGAGGDAIDGDAGSDTASYADRDAPVTVTLDAAANDGGVGEHDDVRTENASGGAGDDVLSGDDGANELSAGAGGADRLSGLGGPDTLIGGSGRDALDGGTGADTLLSFGNRPGVVDELTCGAGEDEAQATRADRVANDCEHVYFGGTPMPRLAIGGGERLRARRGVLRLPVTARPAEAPPRGTIGTQAKGPAITATASLRALRGAPRGVLARARLGPFAAPGAAAMRLRLSRPAARALARRGTIRTRVEISARDTEGNASITRRTVVVRR